MSSPAWCEAGREPIKRVPEKQRATRPATGTQGSRGSHPEGSCLHEFVGRFDRGRAQRRDAGLLPAGDDADGEGALALSCLLAGQIARQPLVDRDVVERAETILQSFEPALESAKALRRLAARKK